MKKLYVETGIAGAAKQRSNIYNSYLRPRKLIKYIMEEKDLNRIKIVLVEKHRTSKWLSEQLGKDPTTVSKWCPNQSQPTLEILLRIAELLDVNYTELVSVK